MCSENSINNLSRCACELIGAPKLDFDGLLLFFVHFSYSAVRCGLDWAHQPPCLASATA